MFLRFMFPAISWAILILLLCLAPADQLPETTLWDFLSVDKIAHCVLFGGLSLFLIVGFRRQYSYSYLRYHSKSTAFLLASAYGLFIEILQLFSSTGRSFEWQDIVADTFGSALGISVFRIIYGKELAK
jgi:VanZ family protein